MNRYGSAYEVRLFGWTVEQWTTVIDAVSIGTTGLPGLLDVKKRWLIAGGSLEPEPAETDYLDGPGYFISVRELVLASVPVESHDSLRYIP